MKKTNFGGYEAQEETKKAPDGGVLILRIFIIPIFSACRAAMRFSALLERNCFVRPAFLLCLGYR
jgi:hypothetical protein